MPFSRLPRATQKAIDTEAKEGGKTKYKGRRQWLAIYHSARKQGKSKSQSAAMAGGGVKKDSLSIADIFKLLEEALKKPSS